MTENEEYHCKDCVYQGTEVCEYCVTVQHPSGKIKKPTYFRAIECSHRAIDISKLIMRCLNNGLPISVELVTEYNELKATERLANKSKS